jgi:ribonuclease P protein component
VPKKKFRLSVQRHRIRRLMAEAWRVNKHALYATIPADKQLQMFILYTGKTEQTYAEVTDGMLKGIERLQMICKEKV